MKRFAFIEYNHVQSIETRCSGFRKSEVQQGELAIEDIIHPDFIHRFVEITEETGEAEKGMLYSDGKFIEDADYTSLKGIAEAVERGFSG